MSAPNDTKKRWSIVVLAAGYGSRLHKDIIADDSGQFIHLLGQPKALLPVAGVPLLSHWMYHFRQAKGLVELSRVYVVTNEVMYPKFVKWSNNQEGFPKENIISDGTKTNDTRLGAVGDLSLVLDKKKNEIRDTSVLIIAGDTLFLSDFSLEFFLTNLKHNYCGCVYYKLSNVEEVSRRGIVEVDQTTGSVQRLLEKPKPSETSSRLAAPAFYALQGNVFNNVNAYLKAHPKGRDVPGSLIGWLLEQKRIKMTATSLSGRFDIEDLSQWKQTLAHFSTVLDSHLNALPNLVTSRVCARIGVMGNPSDGFGGKTLSLSIRNFYAEVTLRPSRRLVLSAHPEFDPNSFANLDHLWRHTSNNGYYGGLRLLKATCRMFQNLCKNKGIDVGSANFTMSYSSKIPRCVGLAGSSAIITAAFKGLLHFYGVKLEDIGLTKATLPQRILDIESKELGINAGLQDRVIQVYGGLVSMDFDEKGLKEKGHGDYINLDLRLLPTMYLAWNTTVGGDSGKVHSTVKERWLRGDKTIVTGMKTVASYVDSAVKALKDNKPEALCELMEMNFAMRRKMYGDNVVGERNIELAELAKANGMAAKFSGSGGAVVCVRKPMTKKQREKHQSKDGKDVEDDPFAFSEQEENRIRLLFISKGYEFVRIIPNPAATEPEVGGEAARRRACEEGKEKSGIVLQID
ncbi:hypothetical protein AAMO2058_001138600 [Amorphochlora amoebiformis]